MTDLERAKAALGTHSVCLVRGDEIVLSDARGIAPLMEWIGRGTPLAGFSAADKIVGKAAALLFVKCKVAAVYAEVLSESGRRILERYGVPYEYGIRTEAVRNRAGTGLCPMEKATAGTDDPEAAYLLLRKALEDLKPQ